MSALGPTPRRVLRLADYARAPVVDVSDLARSDTCRRITLRRADRGGLSDHGELIVDGGRRLPRQLELAARDLLRGGLLAVTAQPAATSARVVLTEHGRAELARLDADDERRRSMPARHLDHECQERTPMNWLTWVFVAACGLAFVVLLIRNLFDRPSPLGTDAEQRERAQQ